MKDNQEATNEPERRVHRMKITMTGMNKDGHKGTASRTIRVQVEHPILDRPVLLILVDISLLKLGHPNIKKMFSGIDRTINNLVFKQIVLNPRPQDRLLTFDKLQEAHVIFLQRVTTAIYDQMLLEGLRRLDELQLKIEQGDTTNMTTTKTDITLDNAENIPTDVNEPPEIKTPANDHC